MHDKLFHAKNRERERQATTVAGRTDPGTARIHGVKFRPHYVLCGWTLSLCDLET